MEELNSSAFPPLSRKEQRSSGQALAVCDGQLAVSLPDIPAGCETSIAYEPLWAIGSGHMPADEDIVAIHGHIRSCAVAVQRRRAVRILYGGSVTSSNACAILGLPDVGGVLIGGASLTAADFDALPGVARTLAVTPGAIAAEYIPTLPVRPVPG